ncbi:hypothetical protein F3Y22_tig00111834pilonHSYRG00003 [Hibiscus syriacus]|uniref:Bulb-type lectin domain-containing protein n=1 Tax=Hibiscus syriacus TaxID=106335 RepID=A0A6A2XAU8_HIBSY|nr:hypothetical protein F3Y22_tig00111834pilonHSYRG00003 [Hibiscus syriacus]
MFCFSKLKGILRQAYSNGQHEESMAEKLPVLLFTWFFNCRLSFGVDTISVKQSLTGNQTIVSSGGNFVLGFFAPGNPSNYYIGISYGKISEQTPVWVANRETPVRDIHFSELKISDDHPARTWLPGGKLSFNKRTNRSQLLTSWKSSEDPTPSLFSLELDPAGTNSIIIRWNGIRQYWSSGPWDEQSRTFRDVPEMRLNYLFHFMNLYYFSFHSDENVSYITYYLNDSEIISRFIMDYSGQIKQLSCMISQQQWNLYWWNRRQQCRVYALCGAFSSCNDNSYVACDCLTGFQPSSEQNCNKQHYSERCVNASVGIGRGDRFLESRYSNLPEGPEQNKMVFSGLEFCSYTAYAFENNQCSIWIGYLLNLQLLGQDDNTTGKTLTTPFRPYHVNNRESEEANKYQYRTRIRERNNSVQKSELKPLPRARKAVGCKWLFKVKRKPDGSVDRLKARLVAKGYSQMVGRDFYETFSPVVRASTIRIVLAVVVMKEWPLRQIDINNAFLNGRTCIIHWIIRVEVVTAGTIRVDIGLNIGITFRDCDCLVSASSNMVLTDLRSGGVRVAVITLITDSNSGGRPFNIAVIILQYDINLEVVLPLYNICRVFQISATVLRPMRCGRTSSLTVESNQEASPPSCSS